jgi:hypothetical protein
VLALDFSEMYFKIILTKVPIDLIESTDNKNVEICKSRKKERNIY